MQERGFKLFLQMQGSAQRTSQRIQEKIAFYERKL